MNQGKVASIPGEQRDNVTVMVIKVKSQSLRRQELRGAESGAYNPSKWVPLLNSHLDINNKQETFSALVF